jgi:hypothetical protein
MPASALTKDVRDPETGKAQLTLELTVRPESHANANGFSFFID